MNAAAATAFITVMLLGMGGLTGLVYRDRRRTAPPLTRPFCGECNLDCDDCICLRPASIYDATIHALCCDPQRIDFTTTPLAW